MVCSEGHGHVRLHKKKEVGDKMKGIAVNEKRRVSECEWKQTPKKDLEVCCPDTCPLEDTSDWKR